MPLTRYEQKRSFDQTPEPTGGKSAAKGLVFVVQKHDASHLHYDFRLEMEGVLKSWAVPKGPSMDPQVKRLAMRVEDHPYDYRTFEGVIPEGNYGAGTVIVWDAGEYLPAEGSISTKQEADKELRRQLHSGKIKFILAGKKLKGEFALVKAHRRGENAWLLLKLNDEFATTDDILEKDKSVISRKSIAQMAKHPVRVYGKKIAKLTKVVKAAKSANAATEPSRKTTRKAVKGVKATARPTKKAVRKVKTVRRKKS